MGVGSIDFSKRGRWELVALTLATAGGGYPIGRYHGRWLVMLTLVAKDFEEVDI